MLADWRFQGPGPRPQAICDVRTWYGKFLLAAGGAWVAMIWGEGQRRLRRATRPQAAFSKQEPGVILLPLDTPLL